LTPPPRRNSGACGRGPGATEAAGERAARVVDSAAQCSCEPGADAGIVSGCGHIGYPCRAAWLGWQLPF